MDAVMADHERIAAVLGRLAFQAEKCGKGICLCRDATRGVGVAWNLQQAFPESPPQLTFVKRCIPPQLPPIITPRSQRRLRAVAGLN